jgi:hypothetical protein
MKIRNYLNLAGATALGVAMVASSAQAQPMDDRVIVDMPYTTNVGNKTLQPGEYVIQRLHSQSGNGRVLLIYSDNGMKFETSTMSIPVLDPDTARDTKIVLTKVGDEYFYDKIWVQGKQYGYEIPLPKEARLRRDELMARVNVPASTSTITTTTQTAQEPLPVETAAAVEPPPIETPQEQAPAIADVEPQANEPVVAANPVPLQEEPAVDDIPSDVAQSANREMDQNPAPAAELPATAAGWLAMMLGGSGLLGAGMMMRRKH